VISQQLNPADHFTLVLDHEIRKSGLVLRPALIQEN